MLTAVAVINAAAVALICNVTRTAILGRNRCLPVKDIKKIKMSFDKKIRKIQFLSSKDMLIQLTMFTYTDGQKKRYN